MDKKLVFILLVSIFTLFAGCSDEVLNDSDILVEDNHSKDNVSENNIREQEASINVEEDKIVIQTENERVEIDSNEINVNEELANNLEEDKIVIQDENISIKVDSQTGQIDVKVNESARINGFETSGLSIEEWCVKGQTFEFEQDGATSSTIIVGVEEYKGKEFCKGESSLETQGIKVDTVYYFTENAKEMWILTTVMGKTTEVHIEN